MLKKKVLPFILLAVLILTAGIAALQKYSDGYAQEPISVSPVIQEVLQTDRDDWKAGMISGASSHGENSVFITTSSDGSQKGDSYILKAWGSYDAENQNKSPDEYAPFEITSCGVCGGSNVSTTRISRSDWKLVPHSGIACKEYPYGYDQTAERHFIFEHHCANCKDHHIITRTETYSECHGYR
ncbi:MAG: hypothetical protein Q4A75_07255 [Peptostreptococcaceae bacterium]|nr:hypothetical protein [Peptostreptococcaceae bacterium]